jgi:hypothetical protein
MYSQNSFCQYQNILINSSLYPNESSIIINPININNIVIGSNIRASTNTGSGFFYSLNGGWNWNSSPLYSSVSSPCGDPVIIVDTSGYFYYITLSGSESDSTSCLQILKSTNNGVNWNEGYLLGNNSRALQDKPWGCVDWSNSIYRNNIYITWTEFSFYHGYYPMDSTIILFSKSTDAGQSWSQPLRISKRKGDARDSCNTVEGAVPCIGPNGEIYVSWSGPIIRNSQYGIFFNKSTDGGITWLDSEKVATFQPGGWDYIIHGIDRVNGFPITACDISNGPYRGTIYINFSDQRNGVTDTDVWLIKSTNGGTNWSSVKRVNDDAPGKHQFLCWMTVDQSTGYIYIVFYDERNLPDYYANFYLARSTDGGETFQNVKISSSPLFVYGGFLGDYTSVSAVNGHIRPVWSNMTNHSIYTAIVDTFYTIGINNNEEIIPGFFKLYQNYPNPFNPVTKISYDLPKSGFVSLKVYDMLGREVTTLVNEVKKEGSYLVDFDGSNLASGVYFFKLKSNDFVDIKKMILLK